jgi:hypothetical protein
MGHTSTTMGFRRFAACVVIAATLTASAAASGSGGPPRFSLSATTATVDEEVSLHVAQVPRLPQRDIRLYLVPTGVGSSVHSRFDPRLSFIGTVRAARRARLVFTVPPLEAGRYTLAYWCRGCLARSEKIGLQASPKLRIMAPVAEGCPTTKPNGNVPPGAPASWGGLQWHGNGALWAVLRPDGSLVTNALGGWKQLWAAKEGLSGRLAAKYRVVDSPATPLTARTGWFSGYERPNSTMSQMSFKPGCWQITGRVRDVSLSFVVEVMLGNA